MLTVCEDIEKCHYDYCFTLTALLLYSHRACHLARGTYRNLFLSQGCVSDPRYVDPSTSTSLAYRNPRSSRVPWVTHLTLNALVFVARLRAPAYGTEREPDAANQHGRLRAIAQVRCGVLCVMYGSVRISKRRLPNSHKHITFPIVAANLISTCLECFTKLSGVLILSRIIMFQKVV